ncbi:MAG: carbon starvation protein A [Candidatus Latescibacteria bacterium]|nr:carbon starvation protein A [Candidatus Latescibacterota bacterium]
MNPLLFILPAFALYGLGYRFYARHLSRAFGEDDSRPTPAVTKNDGVDYVPTRPHILFAHHFSAIAAAGPILGPTWALLYGVLPAWIWIALGGVFLGATHDFACLFASIREEGRSIAEIGRKTLGTTTFVLYILFMIFNLLIVNATFINLTAVSLTSMRPVESLGLSPDQTTFRTIEKNGQDMAIVGGIASSSAIALTVIAPFLGWLLVKRNLRQRYAYPLATLLCIGSVFIGFAFPVSLSTLTWIVLIALYVWLASAVPVWLILQPREFVSVQFLYLGILLLIVSLVGAGIAGVTVQAPTVNIESGVKALGWLWPMLFITIACGAISGFHGIVASGTTSKQISRESHAKHIGYGAMLGESMLAVLVTLAIASGVSYADYQSVLVRPPDAPADWRANPVLAFSLGVAGICEAGLGIPKWLGIVFGLLMVEGFVLDTLDVSIRLNRYLIEEVWLIAFRRQVPRLLKNYWFNSGIAVGFMLVLAYRNTADRLWPIFGTGNQLLAALSLLAVSAWLWQQRRRIAYTLIPALFVGITTIGSLLYLLWNKYLPAKTYLLVVTDVILLGLAGGMIVIFLQKFLKRTVSIPGVES